MVSGLPGDQDCQEQPVHEVANLARPAEVRGEPRKSALPTQVGSALFSEIPENPLGEPKFVLEQPQRAFGCLSG